jgi:hypothetical protein
MTPWQIWQTIRYRGARVPYINTIPSSEAWGWAAKNVSFIPPLGIPSINTTPLSTPWSWSGKDTALVQGDPYWADVLLLLSGTAAGFTDSSSFARSPFSTTGSPVFNSSRTLFGNPTYSLATTDSVHLADSFLTILQAYEWCFEFWVYPITYGTKIWEMSSQISMVIPSNYQINGGVGNIGGGSYTTSASIALNQNAWNHVAFCRDNTTDPTWGYLNVWVDGVWSGQSSSFLKSAVMNAGSGFGMILGYSIFSSIFSLIEMRLTYTTARYYGYSSFTPPTGPFPTS